MKKTILWPTSAILVGALSGFASDSLKINRSNAGPATGLWARIGTVCTLICGCPNGTVLMTGVAGAQAFISSGMSTVYPLYENAACTIPVVFN
ncbi:MAG: hypothetical protein P0Y53_09920 [Candidatus Pseudobacter hemicellulosilyticus]|uniref:Uncharacterized protein n=1 Tax=Candidatus Pseudobacter hemicellulosilyticus TaxID=3121375 RepID=A0AAJ6BI02_9BACT|nr:MAG: hypothetical protein P0Y53_09920 [Pseudobacter sp.]